MKALGIIRNIDDLGRVVIPKEIRKANGWESHTPMEMFSTKDGLLIRKYSPNQEKAQIIKELKAVLDITTVPSVRERVQNAIQYVEQN